MVLNCRIAYRITYLTANGAIQTNNHTLGFVETVAVIWHVNITKNYRILHTV